MLYYSDQTDRKREFEKQLKKRFAVEFKGSAQWYISMKITQLANYDIIVDQTRYLKSILNRFLTTIRMPINKKYHNKPLPDGFVAMKDDMAPSEQESVELQEKHNLDYRALIGCLIYLTYTRADCVYAVNKLAKFCHRPGKYHLDCALHLLCYLHDNQEYGIRFYSDWKHSNIYHVLESNKIECKNKLVAMSDSSWQDCLDTGKSTGGYLIFFSGGLIRFSSNVPSPVAMSSAESEYNQGCLASMEVSYVKMLVEDITMEKIEEPIPILLDNKSAVDMSKTFKHSKHTRHIMRRYHYVKEGERDGKHKFYWVPGDEYMYADFLTKADIKGNHLELTEKVMEKLKTETSDELKFKRSKNTGLTVSNDSNTGVKNTGLTPVPKGSACNADIKNA